MNVTIVIIYISMIVWILPIFRQYKTRMFFFFLILGLSDPINLISISILGVKPGVVHSVAAILLFYALEYRERQKIKFSYSDILLIILFVSAFFVLSNLFYLTFIIHILILSRIIHINIMDVHHQRILNIYYLILCFYEITIVINLLVLFSGTNRGIYLYFITLGFQILIALFFSVFKENNPSLTKNLLSAENR